MDNYKGYYLNHHSDLHYFEGGAHFKYSELYYRLDKLIRTLSKERQGDDYVFDSSIKEKRKIPFSRNAKRIIKSYSQKQLENIEGSDFHDDYPRLNYNNNSKQNIQKVNKSNNHHPRTKSEDLNQKNELIHINFIINKYNSCIYGKSPQNPKILNSTRNNQGFLINPGTNKINHSILHQNNLLIPIPSTSSSTKNMFAKKSLHNKKNPCSLIKVYNNNNSFLYHNNDEQSCLNDNNCTYIKDKMDDCYNKLIKFKSSNVNVNGNNNGSTIIIKPQINFSFVNNINGINLQHQPNESRNKPKETTNLNLFSKNNNNNLISLYKEGNDTLLSNIKSKQAQMIPLKKSNRNYDSANGYEYKTNSKFNQFNPHPSKKSIPINKSPPVNHDNRKGKRDNMLQANFLIKNNNKPDSINAFTQSKISQKKEIIYQSQDILSIGGIKNEIGNKGNINIRERDNSTYYSNNNYNKKINTNLNSNRNVGSTRNKLSFSKNKSDYAPNRYKIDHYVSKNRNLS